jgi:hypothetical protein
MLLPTYHSSCSGVPIKSRINEKIYKLYFLDIGLLNYLDGLEWSHISALNERTLLNEGVLAEQFITQHLAYLLKGLEPPDLFNFHNLTSFVVKRNGTGLLMEDYLIDNLLNSINLYAASFERNSIAVILRYCLRRIFP